MQRHHNLFLFLFFSFILVSCDSKSFKPAEYISKSGIALAGTNTKIELEDGAAILIPANSINQDVVVVIARNPEKVHSLPPLDEGVLQISDFYDFYIEAGSLIDGVDLVLPYEEDRIPHEIGLLTIAIPTNNGWEYVPVFGVDGKITYFTTNPGDPIIAWHFVQTQKDIEENEARRKIMTENKTICDTSIHLEISPKSGEPGTEIQISGTVLPLREMYSGLDEFYSELMDMSPASYIPVTIKVGDSYTNQTAYGNGLLTDENGHFSTSYRVGQEEDGVAISALAYCANWFGTIAIKSEGSEYFEVINEIEQFYEEQVDETEEPITVQEEIPDGSIELPSFVDQPISDAIDWLKENGFRYSWMDGSSELELGHVYKQEPKAGTSTVPHRTTVVLYRTNETIEPDPFGCDSPELTPEEKANCGKHRYSETSQIIGPCFFSENDQKQVTEEHEVTFIYDQNEGFGAGINWTKVGMNTYEEKNSYDDNVVFSTDIWTYTFTLSGFLRHMENNQSDCSIESEATIID